MSNPLRRALRVVTRPVRRTTDAATLVVQPYRGYGTREELCLTGRVFRQPRFGAGMKEGTLRRQLVDATRRLARRGTGGVRITARHGAASTVVETDRDGYFDVVLRPDPIEHTDGPWHEVELEAELGRTTVLTSAEVFVPPASARFVVISDIDDTVLRTGVANKALMVWRLFVQGAESRVAFPGVAAFYRALHHGASGEELNPMLYVSRGPWSIYEVLERFFRLHRIPVGPILFLREWGMTLQRPWPRRAEDHKRRLIRTMLRRYDALPFILVGDSGQHDPEIYARIVEEHPGRVLAVYVRNVSADAARDGEIEKLARRTEEAGSPLVLATDTRTFAEHAVEQGWIAPPSGREVATERARQAEDDRVDRAPEPPIHADAARAEEVAHADAGEGPPELVVEE